MKNNRRKHVIVTRFNVASPGREQSIRLKEGWLSERFRLFENYCLPSVAAQTVKSFEWVVLFDEKTPPESIEKIKSLQNIYAFRSEFTDLFDMRKISPQVVGNLDGYDELLTTRLDNDDMIATQFVEVLQANVKSGCYGVYNFPQGLICSVKRDRTKFFYFTDMHNPFCSLLEPATGLPRTIWAEKHVDIDKIGQIYQIEEASMWMQMVHGNNVSNRIRGRRAEPKIFKNYYSAAPEDMFLKNDTNYLLDNLILYPGRQLYEHARKALKQMITKRGH